MKSGINQKGGGRGNGGEPPSGCFHSSYPLNPYLWQPGCVFKIVNKLISFLCLTYQGLLPITRGPNPNSPTWIIMCVRVWLGIWRWNNDSPALSKRSNVIARALISERRRQDRPTRVMWCEEDPLPPHPGPLLALEMEWGHEPGNGSF